jgi:hypothetical protein
MEALAAGNASALDEAAFHHLEQAWNASGAGAQDPPLVARYEQSREFFRGLLARRAQARQVRSPLHARRAALLAELRQATGIDAELARRAADTLAETQLEWEAVPESDPVDTQRFATLGAEIDAHRRRIEQARTQAEPLRDLIDDARARAAAPARIARAELACFEERAQHHARPEDAELARTLDRELGEAIEGLRQRQRRERDEAADALEQIQAVVAAMEEALGRGELEAALVQARRGARQAQGARSGRAPGAQPAPAPAARRAEAPGAARLEALGHGAGHARACARRSRRFIGSALPPEQLAGKIRAFRNEWQQLDRTSGTTSKSMWERFDRACTAAYAPCAAYFSEQRTTRAANLERKQALIERLETLDRDTDWNAADLRAAERTFNGSEREWRAIGPVDRSLAKELVARHAELRKRLESAVRAPP